MLINILFFQYVTYTYEKIQSGNSIQRNPILTSFISKGLLPYRGLGTGVRRALQNWSKIQFIDNRDACLFTAIIERTKMQESVDKKIEKKGHDPINDPISSMQIEILAIIHENIRISYEELAHKLNVSRATIKRNIQQLKLLKLLCYIGSKKTGYWEVSK
ncbi:MAG: HTH domain-containing protein [Chlamydiales bacterium]|nr:HTH domain-containing protein [Chlamydiales bacterium]